MANIGTFKKVNSEYHGEIVTLGVQAKGVRIVPNPIGPMMMRPVTGSSWAAPRSAPHGRKHPATSAPISRSNSTIRASRLLDLGPFDEVDGEGYSLIWSRSRKQNGDRPDRATPYPATGGASVATSRNLYVYHVIDTNAPLARRFAL